jgi:hypothetical protein
VSIYGPGIRHTYEGADDAPISWEVSMRFVVLVKASKTSESGAMPKSKLFEEMDKYNEKLVKAGIWLAGEGLHPSKEGVRIKFTGDNKSLIDGPFAETKELVAGFWLWQVKSKEEAIEWAKRCPKPHEEDCEIELRQVYELEELGEVMSPELQEREKQLREEIARKK